MVGVEWFGDRSTGDCAGVMGLSDPVQGRRRRTLLCYQRLAAILYHFTRASGLDCRARRTRSGPQVVFTTTSSTSHGRTEVHTRYTSLTGRSRAAARTRSSNLPRPDSNVSGWLNRDPISRCSLLLPFVHRCISSATLVVDRHHPHSFSYFPSMRCSSLAVLALAASGEPASSVSTLPCCESRDGLFQMAN